MDRIRKLFVAGGAGYVGTRLCNLLADSGHHEPDYEVTVFDQFWFGDSLDDRITKIKGDILDLKSSDLVGYDAVIFLAGLSNDPMVAYRPDLNFIQNSAAPTYLAYITKQAQIRRFIGASSCSVYGHTKNKTLTETSTVKPSYPGLTFLGKIFIKMPKSRSECKFIRKVFFGRKIFTTSKACCKFKCVGCGANLKQSINKYFKFKRSFKFFFDNELQSLRYAIF